MSLKEIQVEFTSDEKGYFDRQCPNENCEFVYKIHMEDWKSNVSDECVYCPLCGHQATSDQWFTGEQIKSIEKIVGSYALSYLNDEMDKIFRKMERDLSNNKYVSVHYKPSKKISFINNPIGQRPEWAVEITCEKCMTRYSVIGTAYFCPCCGYNAVGRIFWDSLDSIKKMLESVEDLRVTLEKSYGEDKAESMCKSMIESSLGDIVSAFQKFAEDIYKRIMPDNKIRTNDFQIIEKGSSLFRAATGKGYDAWLTNGELTDLNLLFQQRHILEHNFGLVDKRYIENSGDKSYKEGQRIIVKKKDVMRLHKYIASLAEGLKQFE